MNETSNSIIKRIGKGVSGLSLNVLVNTIGQIAIVPLALNSWGKIRYGEWVTLAGLVLWLRMADLGLQTYVVNRMREEYARNQLQTLQNIMQAALRINILVSILLACLVFVALISGNLKQLLNITTASREDVTVACFCLSCELLLGGPLGVIAGLYRATGLFPRAAVIGTIQQSLLLLVTCCLIFIQTSFSVVAGGRLFVAILVASLTLIDLYRLGLWHWEVNFFSRKWAESLTMLIPSVLFLALPLADYFSNQLTLMVVQKSLNGGEVSRLATHRTAMNFAQMISGILTNSSWPEITALNAKQDWARLKILYHSLTKLNVWIVGIISFGLLPFLTLFYPLWTKGQLLLDVVVLAWLAIRAICWGFWNVSSVFLLATNHQQYVVVSTLTSAIVTYVFSMIFVPSMGIRGVALAGLCGDLAISAWVIPMIVSSKLQDSFIKHILFNGLYIGLGIVLVALFGWKLWSQIDSMFLQYFILLPVCLFLVSFWFLFSLTKTERKRFFGFVFRRSDANEA